MLYFDVKVKTWKPLASTTPQIKAKSCYCAVTSGNNLYVAGFEWFDGQSIYHFNIEGNVWKKQPHLVGGSINNLCIVDDYMYAISSDLNKFPQRYSFSKCQWQTIAKVGIWNCQSFYVNAAIVLHSRVYVLYGRVKLNSDGRRMENGDLHCFDPVKNEWKQKATTCKSHFGSSLLVVNSRLYVAGGNVYIDENSKIRGNPAPVEAYDEETNTWSVVEQKHIPPNKPHAVEIESKVYFIINQFPIDSGIRIPPGERYPVYLDEWENLAKIDNNAVLCYLPVKRESLKAE